MGDYVLEEKLCDCESALRKAEARVKELEGEVAMLTVALANAEAERDYMRAAMHVSTTGKIALDGKEETEP